MWLISSGIVLCGILYSGQLMPGEGAFFGLLILKVILIFGNVCLAVIGMPMLSETIDYRMLTDKAEMRGAYISVFFMVVKGGAALGMALGLAIAGWLGFDATVTSHDEKSAFAIHMAISWVPFVISSAGLFFIWLTPLDERRSAIVNRRLNGRELS